MPDLNELQLFVKVAQSQSFTVAARGLGIPKSSVSRAVGRLEGRLGVRLIERTTRKVALTEAGELYLDRCRRVLDEAEQADLAVGALAAQPRGILRVGAPVMFVRAIIGPSLSEFLAAYPEVRVHLKILGPDSPAREGRLDLTICPGPLQDSGLLMKPIMRIRLGVYASPSYLNGRTLPESPADLRTLDCMTANCGAHGAPADCAVWRLRRGAESREVKIEARVSVPDPAVNHQLALSGAGVSLLSQNLAQPDIEHGRLVRLLPEWEPEPVELHALYPERLAASPKVRAFLQFLRDRFPQ
jgi:DNA-binding transcriptional LysR family regulator